MKTKKKSFEKGEMVLTIEFGKVKGKKRTFKEKIKMNEKNERNSHWVFSSFLLSPTFLFSLGYLEEPCVWCATSTKRVSDQTNSEKKRELRKKRDTDWITDRVCQQDRWEGTEWGERGKTRESRKSTNPGAPSHSVNLLPSPPPSRSWHWRIEKFPWHRSLNEIESSISLFVARELLYLSVSFVVFSTFWLKEPRRTSKDSALEATQLSYHARNKSMRCYDSELYGVILFVLPKQFLMMLVVCIANNFLFINEKFSFNNGTQKNKLK